MITFKELYSNLDELKVVNIAQRKKMAIRMKRMTQSSAFKQKVARSKLKIADPAKMQIKAAKQLLATLENEIKALKVDYVKAEYFVS